MNALKRYQWMKQFMEHHQIILTVRIGFHYEYGVTWHTNVWGPHSMIYHGLSEKQTLHNWWKDYKSGRYKVPHNYNGWLKWREHADAEIAKRATEKLLE